MIFQKKYFKKIIVAIILLFCFFACMPVAGFVIADTVSYTDVLQDLKKDENFKVSDYPLIADDYTLQVIQIAESTDNELLIYVYQPSGISVNLIATTINISLTLHNDLNFKNYDLTLLNKNGVFYKYLVNELTVSDDNIRYYELSSIFRAWHIEYDEPAEDGNVITEVSFSVGKQYTIITEDNKVSIYVADVDVVTITDKYVGFVRYDDGYAGNPGVGLSWHCPGADSHFVAFSTDRDIDRLYKADVYYTAQTYSYFRQTVAFITASETETFGEVKENYSYLSYTDHVDIRVPHGTGFFGYTRSYDFDRIQTVDDFIATEDRQWVYSGIIFNYKTQTKITDEGLQDLGGKDWVLRFAETDYSNYVTNAGVAGANSYYNDYTLVGNVTTLRLVFEADGVVYNLGVIDNKQTGDGIPDNETTIMITLSYFLQILILIFLLIVLGPFISAIIKILWDIIKFIFNILLNLFKSIFGNTG